VIAQAIQQSADAFAGPLAVPVVSVAIEEIEDVVEHGVVLLAAAGMQKTRPHPEWMSQGLATRGSCSLPAPVRITARIDDYRPASHREAWDTPPVAQYIRRRLIVKDFRRPRDELLLGTRLTRCRIRPGALGNGGKTTPAAWDPKCCRARRIECMHVRSCVCYHLDLGPPRT
jgi:hypothetical protein